MLNADKEDGEETTQTAHQKLLYGEGLDSPDEGLDGRLANQSDEEELLYDGGGHGAQRRQAKEQLAESCGLVRVLRPAVLLQGTLRLLLQPLDV